MRFFGFPLKREGAMWAARIDEGPDVWDVKVFELPGPLEHWAAQRTTTWTAEASSSYQTFVSRGHASAEGAVRGLEREVRSAVERLGKLTRGPKPGPAGGEG